VLREAHAIDADHLLRTEVRAGRLLDLRLRETRFLFDLVPRAGAYRGREVVEAVAMFFDEGGVEGARSACTG
jgi:hypothetical protein